MENILKPKGMLCNIKLHAGQLVDPVDILWSTSQQVDIPVDIYKCIWNLYITSKGQCIYEITK